MPKRTSRSEPQTAETPPEGKNQRGRRRWDADQKTAASDRNKRMYAMFKRLAQATEIGLSITVGELKAAIEQAELEDSAKIALLLGTDVPHSEVSINKTWQGGKSESKMVLTCKIALDN